MYQTRGAAWIGFEEAQKTINALKVEVEQAEKKLSKAKRALKHDMGDASSNLLSPQTTSTSVMHNVSNRNEHVKHFVKHIVPKQQPYIDQSHKKRGKFTVPTIIKFSSDSEDQPNLVPSNVHSFQPADIKLSKVTSSDTSNSYKSTQYDSSSSEKTSSLIADTYANIDSKLSTIIERNKNKNNADASKITFTSWEEGFLKSYVDFSDVEVLSSQSDKPLENITNGMEWTPVFNNNKLPRTKKIADDGLLALKQIIDRQKRLHEEVCSKSEGHYSPSENVDPPIKFKFDPKTSNLEDLTFTDIEAEAQVRPPPTRKVRLVTALPRYRGFSTPGSYSTSNKKHSKKPVQNVTDKKTPALRKKTASNKIDVPKSPVEKNNQAVQKETKNLLSENEFEEKSDSNSYDVRTSDTLPKIDYPKENIEKILDSELSDQILVENGKENSPKDYSTDININSNIESQATSVDTVDKTEEQYNVPKFFPVCKSVKRKARKVHAEEKMAPSPKIRHYDTKAVRDYIKKKKAERRKRHLEEHKKSLEEVERKKESLQKLLEFQKQSLTMSTTKPLSPTKVHQKKIELKSKGSEIQFLSELNILHKDKIKHLQSDATKKSHQMLGAEKLLDPASNKTSKININLNNENTKLNQQAPISECSQKQNDKKVQTNVVDVELKAGISGIITSEENYENNKAVENQQNVASLTSYEYQSTNLSDYISSINTTTELSQLPSFDGFPPQKLESEKSKLPKGKLKPTDALKSLVKSIDEMTAPYEHLIRTKAWVDQSPPPPNRKSTTKQRPERINYAPSSHRVRNSTDFVVDVAKSLHSFEGNSFIQQVTNIGDTSDLYAKILGQSADHGLQNSNFEETTPVEAALASSHTAIDSYHEYSLIEGSLESDSSLTKENEANSKINPNQYRLVLASDEPAIPEFEAPKIVPDPFNFINTWNRKPLGIPLSPKEGLAIPTNQVAQDTKSIDIRTNNVQSDNYNTKSSTLAPSMHSSFVSNNTETARRTVRHSASSNNISEMTNKNKSVSEYSSQTPVPSSYSSVVTGSLTSETISSRNSPEDRIDQSGSNHQEADIKAASPSESSISEVVSVIANSKNGEKEQTDASVRNGSSKSSSVEEEKIFDGDVQEVEFPDGIKSSLSEVVQKSPEGSIQEVLEESPLLDDIDRKQNQKNSKESSSPSVNSEIKSHSIISEQKESFEENISEVAAPSKKDVTIDFTQPVRLTLSNGVPKSLKILKESLLNEEQYLHTQVVTRVASEAAAAAASSAVIAVFETQKKLLSKENEGTRLLFPGPSGSKNYQRDRSESSVSSKISPGSGSPNYEHSDNTVEEDIEEKASSISTVKEDFHFSNEGDNLSEYASISTKTSASHAVSEELPVLERSKGQKKISRKALGNLSSPSPVSLSENDSISSVAIVSTNSAPSSSLLNESILSDDSFARLTEDVVRKMSYEEKRRANHQLAVLRFEEKTLVENARSQMALLESIKKKLRDKGANVKASLIKKKQKELILRLRQERAQLRCMQEAYRSMCEMHHTMLTDERKILHGQDILSYQLKKNREKPHSSKTSSEHKLEISRIRSDSSSTSAILTEEESKEEDEEEVTGLDVQLSKSITSNSHDSIIETIASEKAKSTVSTHSQTPKISPTSFPQSKQGTNQSNHAPHSNESALQGLKKLDASKRHLSKREQRILQRRKHVERLLQWQIKLDSEEMEVRELEQKAVELVDTSKKKTKYYMSSSPSATPNDDGNTHEKSLKVSDDVDGNVLSDKVTLQHSTKSTAPKSIQSSSTPEENIETTASGGSVDEVLSRKTSNEPESSSTSSVQEIEKSHSVSSSIKTAENTAESSCVDEITTNGTSPNIKSDSKKELTSDVYSESFESALSQNTLSPASNSPAVKTSTPSPSSKKERNFSIKSPLAPRSFRRHDSSGSDDSYTISHSETASDQSDIEVRIHALSEELRRRRYEAEKLKREQKRKYRERLKGTELSLQKQVEAYNQYIQQVKAELEQIESVPSQSQVVDISSVKPQIKWPRPEHVIDSRRIRKKSMSSDPVLLEKRSIDHVSSSPESAESTLEFPKKQGKFLKKLYPETKEKPSLEIVTKQEILDTDERKIPEANESTSTEKVSLNKVPEVISEASKPSMQSKEETEIEESYESNSSIGTADPISEKSISVKEVNSKSTYQSDSFVSSSSTISQSLKDSETLDKQTVQDKTESVTETVEKNSEFTTEAHEDSENSHDSRKFSTNESAHSSGEYTSESSVNTITNTESVKEDYESGSLEEENSDGSSSSPSKKSLDDKMPVKAQMKSPKNSSPELQSISKDKTNNVSKIANPSLKELKTETFIVNVVTYLSSSMLEDAVRKVINLSNNYPILIKPSDNIIKESTFDSSGLSSVKKLTEKSIQLITNDLLNLYLKDAFKSIINIANDFKHSSGDGWSNNQTSELNAANNVYIESTKSLVNIPSENPELKNGFAVQEKAESGIFKKHTDWLEDGFVTTPWDPQQLEQQLLLQQYPYLYRKIPNKPPPPYTPPATLGINSQHIFPLPIKREKPVEKVDPIKHVTKNIDVVVGCIVDSLLDGKSKGLMVSEITEADFSAVVEQLELRNPCQVTFLNMVFDLAKDIALDIYKETDEKRAPWIRPRKLTPKPKFPTNKNKLAATLQKEVEKALKLLPTESYTEQMRKKPTWATMKLGRKKRDFVDTILISEIKEEEPDWINYDEEEVAVKKQIAEAIFDYLVDDTVNLIKSLESKFHK